MKTKLTKTAIILFAIGLVFTSCKKEEFNIEKSKNSNSNSYAPELTEGNDESSLKATYNYSTYTKYIVESKYFNNYEHHYQFNLWSGASSLNLCGPTSDMVAIGMVANAEGKYYDVGTNKLKQIYDDMHDLWENPVPNIDFKTSVYQLDIYNDRKESSYITSLRTTKSSREDFKNWIKEQLGDGYPVIIPVAINGSRYARDHYVSNDMDPYNESGTNYYVDSEGKTGHYLIITRLDLTPSGAGSVIWYRDVYRESSYVKKASYSRILDANRAMGSTYSGLVIRKK